MSNPRFVSSRKIAQEKYASWGGSTGWDGNIDSRSRIEVVDDSVSPAPDISEYAVHSWPMSSGTGMTVSDVVGSADGTLIDAAWKSGDHVDGYAIEAGGNDTHIDFGTLDGFGSAYGYQGFSFAVTLDIGSLPSGNTDLLVGVGNDSARFVIELGTGWTYGVTGHPLVVLQDPHQDTIRVRSTEDFQNERSRLLMTYSGGSNVSALSLYKNGVDVTENVANQSYSGVGDFRGGFYLFGKDGVVPGSLDSAILFDRPLTAEEARIDYQSQPWSET